jgi:hypothetical protein
MCTTACGSSALDAQEHRGQVARGRRRIALLQHQRRADSSSRSSAASAIETPNSSSVYTSATRMSPSSTPSRSARPVSTKSIAAAPSAPDEIVVRMTLPVLRVMPSAKAVVST